MKERIYISANEELKKKLKEQTQTKYQVIYTDDITSADYIIIQRQEDENLSDAQFRDLVKARELGLKVNFIKAKDLQGEIKISAMKDTRKKFDLEI